MKKTAIILSVISLVAWLIPIVGVIVSITGIVLSRKEDQEFPKPALIIGAVGLIASIANWVAGTVMYMNAL